MRTPSDIYCYHVHTPRKLHLVPPRFIHRDALTVGFSSLYGVAAAEAAAIESAGTVAGFKGVVWSERLWIDVDSYAEADLVEAKLKEMNLDFVAYDSGGRGAHFGVLRPTLPSHLLPAQDKRWVQQHFAGADTSIYTHLHLFRVDGTVHETSGRNKRLVFEHRGEQLILPALEKAVVDTTTQPNVDGKAVFECYRVMSNSIPTKSGNRHPTYVKLVYALKDDAGVAPPVARWWLGEVNKMSAEPKGDEELDQVVRSIYG